MQRIMAPMDGWCASLDEVPDEVFANRMLGDGLAIDPTGGVVFAPCDGEIVTLPNSGHAVSIRGAQNLEVLIHVGIDTVHLAGRGFVPRVQPGSRVRLGDELIRFDLDLVARAAKSLITPVVVTLDGAVVKNRRGPGPVKAGELLFEVESAAQPERAPPEEPQPAGGLRSQQHAITVTLRQGLHARPAAMLARRAKAAGVPITLAAHGRESDARSVVGIMALGVRCGDELLVRSSGGGLPEAVAAMVAGLEEAQRMDAAHAPSPGPAPAHAPAHAPTHAKSGAEVAARPGEMAGVGAVPGFAVGRTVRIERREIEVAERGQGSAHEQGELDRARANVKLRLQRMRGSGGSERQEIIGAHLEFLDDPVLIETAAGLIAQGKSAGFAWRGATRRSIAVLEGLEDARLRERADDLLDVEAHVLLALAGEARPLHLPLPEQAVLLAEDLLPSELTALDRRRLAGIALSGGGATSHVAILAAAMEIPMLIGVGSALRSIAEGQSVILDADNGRLNYAPTADDLAQANSAVEHRRARRAALRMAAAQECRARDGTRIEVFANIGNTGDAVAAVENGAEGCGLLRTEFLFIDRDTAPSEDEQLSAYQGIANALGGRPLILRMMDVGGDKPLKYLPMPSEANPALGLRGVRTALSNPDLMRTQLRAALRVTPRGITRVLIPMVTDRSEILAVRLALDDLARELKLGDPIVLGAMIETPAAALTAATLLQEVDFLSIGSNDLTQYTLAMDRGHTELARRTDALHPAVLQLIAAVGRAGDAAGKLVAVCGGVAADRTAVPILLGLGVRELSVVPAVIPAIKRQISALNIADCKDIAQRCLALGSAGEVRGLVEQSIGHLGETL